MSSAQYLLSAFTLLVFFSLSDEEFYDYTKERASHLLQWIGVASSQHQHQERASAGIAIIGATLSHTGTVPLKQTLERFGYRCYHEENALATDDSQLWRALADTDSKEAAESVITHIVGRGFDCVTGCPTCTLYPEMIRMYPKAKVILTVQDNATVWAEDALTTVFAFGPILHSPPFIWSTVVANTLASLNWTIATRMRVSGQDYYPKGHPGTGEILARGVAERLYDDYVADVKAQNLAPSQLLVYNARQGSQPLCAFLRADEDDGHAYCPEVAFSTHREVLVGLLFVCRCIAQLALHWQSIAVGYILAYAIDKTLKKQPPPQEQPRQE